MDAMDVMKNFDIEDLDVNISRIAASREPLSADVVFIRKNDCTYVYDTGSLPENAEYIMNIEGRKVLVISHFHPDHIACLKNYDMGFSEIYASAYTFKHLGDIKGDALLKPVTKLFELGDIDVFPLPSSHSKGCIAVKSGRFLFVGDALYGKLSIKDFKIKTTQYNVQLLLEGMNLISEMDIEEICLSHQVNFRMEKEAILYFMKMLYDARLPDSPYVNSTDAFIKD